MGDMISECGPPDDLIDVNDPKCKIHYMYGEEFFGTLEKAMFTSFRFMIGDYSTRNGKSIIVAFSAGFGLGFDVIFVSWMIVVLFGLFNIITAIFVDSTISGLKHNDIKRKYARQYENRYVQNKLRVLVDRVETLYTRHFVNKGRQLRSARTSLLAVTGAGGQVAMSEDAFQFIMGDGQIRELLADLDISIYDPRSLFDTFDPDGNGVVTCPELVQAVMKLRGEPQKNDIVASWISLKSLHDKFDEMQMMMLERDRTES